MPMYTWSACLQCTHLPSCVMNHTRHCNTGDVLRHMHLQSFITTQWKIFRHAHPLHFLVTQRKTPLTRAPPQYLIVTCAVLKVQVLAPRARVGGIRALFPRRILQQTCKKSHNRVSPGKHCPLQGAPNTTHNHCENRGGSSRLACSTVKAQKHISDCNFTQSTSTIMYMLWPHST